MDTNSPRTTDEIALMAAGLSLIVRDPHLKGTGRADTDPLDTFGIRAGSTFPLRADPLVLKPGELVRGRALLPPDPPEAAPGHPEDRPGGVPHHYCPECVALHIIKPK